MLIILTQVPKHFNSVCLLSWLRSSLLDTAFRGSNENTSFPYSDLSKLEVLTTSLKTVAYTPFMMLEIQDGRVAFRPRTSIHLSFTPEKRKISSYFYLSHAPHLDTSRRDCANVAEKSRRKVHLACSCFLPHPLQYIHLFGFFSHEEGPQTRVCA